MKLKARFRSKKNQSKGKGQNLVKLLTTFILKFIISYLNPEWKMQGNSYIYLFKYDYTRSIQCFSFNIKGNEKYDYVEIIIQIQVMKNARMVELVEIIIYLFICLLLPSPVDPQEACRTRQSVTRLREKKKKKNLSSQITFACVVMFDLRSHF